MDNSPNAGSAGRCRVFKKLHEKAAGAWEADALPTELFPLNDLCVPTSTWGRNGTGRYHAVRTLSHYTDNMDNVPNQGSAVRCRVFRKLREKAGGAWEADALPTELLPHLRCVSRCYQTALSGHNVTPSSPIAHCRGHEGRLEALT